MYVYVSKVCKISHSSAIVVQKSRGSDRATGRLEYQNKIAEIRSCAYINIIMCYKPGPANSKLRTIEKKNKWKYSPK